MKIKRLINSRIKISYGEDSILIKIPPKNIIETFPFLVVYCLLFFSLPLIKEYLDDIILLSLPSLREYLDSHLSYIFYKNLILFVGIFHLIYLWKGKFFLKIDKFCCTATWSIFQIKYKSITIDSSEITDVTDIGVSLIRIKYGDGKKIKLNNILITTKERRWLVRKIRKFLNLKPIALPQWNSGYRGAVSYDDSFGSGGFGDSGFGDDGFGYGAFGYGAFGYGGGGCGDGNGDGGGCDGGGCGGGSGDGGGGSGDGGGGGDGG